MHALEPCSECYGKLLLSDEEFLDWCDEDTLAEWVEGEIVMSAPASYSHQCVADPANPNENGTFGRRGNLFPGCHPGYRAVAARGRQAEGSDSLLDLL